MYFRVLLCLLIPALFAADEQQVELALRAQTDFDRAALAAIPQVPDTARCIQSQAALLSVARQGELSLVHYRKGFCTLAGATVTNNAAEFRDAAGEFDKAIESWPDRALGNPKNSPPEPVSSGLRMLAAVARLKAGADLATTDRERQEIAAAVQPAACVSSIMTASYCQSLMQTGRDWLGWMALQRNDLYEAARDFTDAPQVPWAQWTAGRQAFVDRQYKDAAAHYRRAVDNWVAAERNQSGSIRERLEPSPELPQALTDLGGSQLLSGDLPAATASLDAALKADPSLARAAYLRARAFELAGNTEQAMAEYNLASRTAFANAKDLASGEAHLYRGILMYRRKDYAHAENEFASALNFDISPALKPDAVAWRHMAAVAGGSCSVSRQYLEESLAQVSPYFPKQEARAVAGSCPLTSAGGTASLDIR
jgi:tetratricopeptide (TPR) repeat protein